MKARDLDHVSLSRQGWLGRVQDDPSEQGFDHFEDEPTGFQESLNALGRAALAPWPGSEKAA